MPKTFKDQIQQKALNPTMQFISHPQPERPQEAATEPQRPEDGKAKGNTPAAKKTPQTRPQARRAQPKYAEETKSRRLQLLLTPSLYEAVREKADLERVSVNEMINTILSDAVRK